MHFHNKVIDYEAFVALGLGTLLTQQLDLGLHVVMQKIQPTTHD